MVRMLASSVVYGGFKPLSGQTKSVKLVLDASLLSTNINGERTKTGWEVYLIKHNKIHRNIFILNI
jgi:hypothetical protein